MKKLAIAFAGLAAIGFSGVAFADEATKGPAAMTDAEMDKVTAGAATILIQPPCSGGGTMCLSKKLSIPGTPPAGKHGAVTIVPVKPPL
jgi:hypothetical protein